jgi:hypothetical protein
LVLSCFLLPAISSTLKIRKRKLAQTSTSNTTSIVVDAGSNVSFLQTNNLILDFSSKISTVISAQYQTADLTTALSFFTAKIEFSRKLKYKLLNQLQSATFFF